MHPNYTNKGSPPLHIPGTWIYISQVAGDGGVAK